MQRLARFEETEAAQISLGYDALKAEITTSSAKLVSLINASKVQCVDRLRNQLAKRE